MKTKSIIAGLILITNTSLLHAHDVDGDGQIGLAEAIHALQVVAGIIPTLPTTGDALPEHVLNGTIFSHSEEIGLKGTMVDNGAKVIIPSTFPRPIWEGWR